MMITRALFVALCCACAHAITTLTAGNDDSDCALYLSGPGRTSAYDYSINLLKGNFGYEGQSNCITYEAVNQAYLEARNRILVAQPKGDWKPEDFGSVGELMLDISINLARRYGLTYEEIEKGLPLIDTARTLIREVCPPVFSHVECRAGKYRRLDGLCNNLQHPTWGATMAPFQRLIGPLFADGINAPRISHTGHDLPLSRVVSRTMHPDDGFHDHAGTVMVIAWGQFMDHDYTLTGTPLDPINRNDPEECCKRPPHLKHPYCNEIRIPDDDYFYKLWGVKCIDFVRGFPSPRPGCRLGSRVPFNTLTGAIDGNTVYGVTEKFARKLRTGFGGLLRMNPVFKEYGLKDLLPLKLDIPDEGCTRPNKNMYCFEAGEIRVNEQLVLTVMHTLMAREHNRVANALAEVNPHWDDETLYQEARRINIAEIQHITYNEFLPILLGKDVMEKFGLVLEKEGYWDGYDPEVNPDVLASFAAAAYRFGHSLLPTAVERWSKAHKFIASKRLSDLIRRPYDLYRAGVLDEYVMGLMNQVAQAMDDSITQEVTNHLFKKVGARFGMDLVSFNMQRGREFGLPGYMEFRKFCGLPWADDFQGLFGSMPNQTVRKYESIFERPIDVDLWSGGVSERPLPGSMLGPTFACIIATQFSYSRRGDRFWFELPNQPSSFTPEQLKEIRKARLSRVICDNTDIIDTVQLYPMVLPDHELNPRVPCRSGIIPSMDFSKWAEPSPFQGSAKQFITEAIIVEKNITNNYEQDKKESECGEQNCNCNGTLVVNNNITYCSNEIALPAQAVIDCSNSTNNDCNVQSDTTQNDKENEILDSNTVLKYVYKKNEKTDSLNKTKGHNKNSLKRRKRSAVDENDTSGSSSSFNNSPLIVDYETTHRPRGKITWLTSSDNPNIIRGSDLANFNILTKHENLNKNDESSRNLDRRFTEADHLNDRPPANQREDFTDFGNNRNSNYNRDRENDEEKNEKDREYHVTGEHARAKAERNRDINDHIRENTENSNERGERNRESRDRGLENIERSNEKDYNLDNRDRSRENIDHSFERNDHHRDSEERSRESTERNNERGDRYRKIGDHSRENSEQSHDSEDGQHDSDEIHRNSGARRRESGKRNRDSEEHHHESSEDEFNNNAKYVSPSTNSRKTHERGDNEKPYSSSAGNKENVENISKEHFSDSIKPRSDKLDSSEKDAYRPEIEPYDPRPLNLPVVKLSDDKDFSHAELINQDIKEYDSQPLKLPDVQISNNKEFPHPESFTKDIKAFDSRPLKLPEVKLPNSNDFPHPESFTKDIKAFDSRPLNFHRPDSLNRENSDENKSQINLRGDYTKEPYTKNTDPNSAVEILPLSLVKSKTEPNSIKHDTSQIKDTSSNENFSNGPVHIDDGEVKPVVEISGEQSEENSKPNDAENTSLESLLGVKINSGLNDKILVQKDDVKQQFERIPLNYQHDVDKDKEQNKDIEKIDPPKDDTDLIKNQGTLDVFAPDNVQYDENLNIKFDDVTVKLPEIKLPDDILAYARENSPFKDELNEDEPLKKPFYNYNSDDEVKLIEPPVLDSERYNNNYRKKNPVNNKTEDTEDDEEEDEADRTYYGPYYEDEEKNQDYKNEETEDEGEDEEDLYEKFVRERFGKHGTFEKRSEQLRESTETPLNPHLYKTIQNILNKTAEIEKQAVESGDPKAGYMWTLEYGENL